MKLDVSTLSVDMYSVSYVFEEGLYAFQMVEWHPGSSVEKL